MGWLDLVFGPYACMDDFGMCLLTFRLRGVPAVGGAWLWVLLPDQRVAGHPQQGR